MNKGITSIEYWRMLELPKVITTAKGTITYTHDELGNKPRKVTVETASAANGNRTITTTNYVGGAVFESRSSSPADPNNPNYSNKLQFLAHEEARIRALYTNSASPNTLTGFAYDYFIKDTDVFYYHQIFNKINTKENLNYKLYFLFNNREKSDCEWVKEIVLKLREGGMQKLYGIIDWDGKIKSTAEVLVPGESSRYVIENFVYDPIYLAILFLQMGGVYQIRELL